MDDMLFRRRKPEAAARQMAIVLMNLLECQMATLEGMPKSASQYQRRRQASINETYLRHVVELDISEETRGLLGAGCPRVSAAMKAMRAAALQTEGER
jgi:hypothetical protein